jgi:hypothetical protein
MKPAREGHPLRHGKAAGIYVLFAVNSYFNWYMESRLVKYLFQDTDSCEVIIMCARCGKLRQNFNSMAEVMKRMFKIMYERLILSVLRCTVMFYH